MKILDLKYERKRGADRIIVEHEGGQFEVDAELAVRYHLKKGAELSDATFEELEREQARLQARRRLIAFLSARKKSQREAEAYLQRLRMPADAIERAIATARELGLIDDRRYAEAYVRTQSRTGAKGPRALRDELLARGIDTDMAESTVSAMQAPEMQHERATELAHKKAASLGSDEPAKARQKLYAFLLRKGYDPEIVAEVVREALAGNDEE